MVDFEWYRSFISVYRSGTVTSAAKARFLTQPAISQHIAALEVSVGNALFERTHRKMIPTDQGKALYNKMAPAVDTLEKVSINLKDNTPTQSPLMRLGVPLDYFHEVGLSKLIHSQFRLQVEIGDTDVTINALSRGKLDGVIATQQTGNDNIDYKKIGQETFYLVSSPDITLPDKLQKPDASLSEIERFLLETSWISYSIELPIIRRFWHTAFNHRPSIEPVMVIPSLLCIRQAVELGLGISVLPDYLCLESITQGRLKILWQTQQVASNDLWLATRKVDRNKPDIEKLVLLMKNM